MSGFNAINASPPTPQIPGKAEFADDVETEEFYVLLSVPPGDTESVQKKETALPADRVQILDLHTDNPMVSCRGEIYSCSWADVVGTSMYFLPPKGNSGGLEGMDVSEVTAEQIIAAARMEEEGESARFVGLGTARLEGKPVTVKLAAGAAQSKRKNVDEAFDFNSKLEETLKRRQIREKLQQQMKNAV